MTSLAAELVTHVEDLWKSVRAMSRQIVQLDRDLRAADERTNQLIAGIGDAAYGPFSFSPPPFLVRIEAALGTGHWGARRLFPDMTGLIPDSDDDGFYHVRTLPWSSGMFIGARGWVQHLANFPSLISGENSVSTAFYSPLDGEWRPFAAQTTDEPEYVGDALYYPWTQVGAIAGEQYASGVEITLSDDSEVTLGNAQFVTQAGNDIDHSYERVSLEAGTPCLVWFDAADGEFKMLQASERKADPCP